MAFITHNMTTAQSLNNLQIHFKKIDENGDGRIAGSNFKKCINKIWTQFPNRV